MANPLLHSAKPLYARNSRHDQNGIMQQITKVLNPNDPYLRRAHRRYIKLGQWKRPPHKTLVWITYSPAMDLTTAGFAFWNAHNSKWYWDSNLPITGYEVLAWSKLGYPEPFVPTALEAK